MMQTNGVELAKNGLLCVYLQMVLETFSLYCQPSYAFISKLESLKIHANFKLETSAGILYNI